MFAALVTIAPRITTLARAFIAVAGAVTAGAGAYVAVRKAADYDPRAAQ